MHLSDPSPFAPLPGTTPSPCGLFVDRWGTLLAPPASGFALSRGEVAFYEGALEALFQASRAGWRIYLIGNEEHVAQGRLAHEAWSEVEEHIQAQLHGAGVTVARSYACCEHPEGVPGRRGDSVYHLPNTGAFYHAAHTDGVELRKSWVVGDSTLELVAGWRAGCRLASVQTGLGLGDGTFEVTPDMAADDLSAVVSELLQRRTALHP